jgi:DNA-binding MarR family transcriptional regulator
MQDQKQFILEIEKNIIHYINKTSIDLKYYFNVFLKETNYPITPDEWILLFHLLKSGGKNQKWYGEVLFKDKTATMRIIDNLEKKKLIERIQDKNDRRQNLLYITEKGIGILNNLFPIIIEKFKKINAYISSKDIEITKAALQKISENIGIKE